MPPGCGVDDGGQQAPNTVSFAIGQDAARPTPGSVQVSAPVGVEPAAQQASPSAVIGPGHTGAAHEPSACGDLPTGQHDSPPWLSWLSGHADADANPLAGWHVPSDRGVEDDGQQPEDVSCASGQDAATPPPGNLQASSPVGAEPGAQQASPSAVIRPGHGRTVAICGHEPSAALGPEQTGFASSLFATPEVAMIAAAATKLRAAAKIFWRNPSRSIAAPSRTDR